MLTVVKQHLRLFGRYVSFNLQSSMEYKTNFLIQTFGMVLNNLAFLFFWWVLFDRMNNQIGGYQYNHLMVIWAICSTGFGLSQALFGNSIFLTELIIEGQLDTYLLQPKSVLWNILISKTTVAGWGDVLYGVVLICFAMPLTLLNICLFLLFSVLAACLFTAVMVIGHVLTFYLGRSSAIGDLLPDFVLTLSIYPEGIFGGVTRFLLYTLLPAGFISYIPVRLLTQFSWSQLGYLLAFDVFFVALAYWLFNLGLKKYESGNLMQGRV